MLEATFKQQFIDRVKVRLQDIDLDFIHLKAPSDRSKPDLVILGPLTWAALEFKRRKNAKRGPNQDYHVRRMNEKGFARFVYPSNQEEVMEELVRLFDPTSLGEM